MKKKILIVTICIIAAVSAGVYGTIQVMENQQEQEALNTLQQTVTENPLIEQIEQIESEPAVQNDFMIMAQQMIARYHMTNEEINYLSGLYAQGYELEWLCQIFPFYITCGENISIIKDIYDTSIEQEIEDRYWVENAYNAVTNNCHGVLDQAGVMDYFNQGMDSSQIQMANTLSRKGVYTISQILDKRVEGIEWPQLINEIWGTDINDLEDKSVEDIIIEKRIAVQNEFSMRLAANVAQAEINTAGLQPSNHDDTIRNALIKKGISIERVDALLTNDLTLDEIYNCKILSETRELDFDEVLRLYLEKGKWSKLIRKGANAV